MKARHPIRGAASNIEVILEDAAWRGVAPDIVKQVKRAAAMALQRSSVAAPDGDVVVLLGEDARLRRLNRQHRGKDKPTNVLSFPAAPRTGYLGDIAIAYGVAKREADAARKPLLHHLLHLTVHGVLHLLGYDHEEPAQAERMEALEAGILGEMGIPDPYHANREPV